MTAITQNPSVNGAPAPVVFQFQQFPINVITKDGEPWFIASEICKALDIKNARDAVSRLDEDERGVGKTDAPSKNQHGEFGTVEQEVTIISEPGLYRLIGRSNKPAAKTFNRWLCHDVLPAIRKTGSYSMAPAALVIERGPVPLEKRPSEWVQRVNRRAYSLSQGMYTPYRTQILAANPDVPEEWLPDSAVLPGVKALPSARYHYPRNLINQTYFVSPKSGTATLDLGMLCSPEFVSPLLALLHQLRSEGHDITAAYDEAQALRTALDNAGIAFASINALTMRAMNGSAE